MRVDVDRYRRRDRYGSGISFPDRPFPSSSAGFCRLRRRPAGSYQLCFGLFQKVPSEPVELGQGCEEAAGILHHQGADGEGRAARLADVGLDLFSGEGPISSRNHTRTAPHPDLDRFSMRAGRLPFQYRPPIVPGHSDLQGDELLRPGGRAPRQPGPPGQPDLGAFLHPANSQPHQAVVNPGRGSHHHPLFSTRKAEYQTVTLPGKKIAHRLHQGLPAPQVVRNHSPHQNAPVAGHLPAHYLIPPGTQEIPWGEPPVEGQGQVSHILL